MIFFVNIGPSTELNIPEAVNINPKIFLKDRQEVNFLIAHISEEEVIGIINALENKTSGPTSIPIKMLKMIPDLIIIPLCRIINMSFITGVFPEILKIVKVIPVHKGGSTQDMNNFRPISLLSIFDKIMEKLLHKRLYDFLEKNNILFKNQFGFRKNNSTIFALLQITEKIRESIDKGKYGCGIFIDLRKALDTVNHQILLQKLDHYGIRGSALSWFESYFDNRRQYVYFNGESSDLKSISCGVPQGSVLGPLLFLLYINDLPNISSLFDFYLFADDTNLYYEDVSFLISLEQKINKELKKLNLWLNVNRLSLNIAKPNFVIFHSYNKPLKGRVTIVIKKKAIAEKSAIKYLGVTIDSTLSWNDHILNISKKISRAIGVMFKIRPFVNTAILKNLYYALIYSHLVYAIQIWGSACDTHLMRLMVLQKRALRLMVYEDFNDIPGPLAASAPIFAKLEILKLKDIFIFQISRFIHNCLRSKINNNFHNWFILNNEIHNYHTRSNYQIAFNIIVTNNLFIPIARTTNYGLKLTKVIGPKIWNSIPWEIRKITSICGFKKSL